MKHVNQLIRQFANAAGQGRRVEHRVATLVDEHFMHPARRDGRGRKAKELRAVEKALRHMNRATAWQGQQNLDPNVRQDAKALVRTVCHGQLPFNELMNRVSALRGRLNEAGRVRNARKPIEGCDSLREELPQGFSVERLHTVELLAEAGRLLGNCAKNNGHGLHEGLREREWDFYLIRRDDDPVAMFDVELETGKITQFLGRANADVELPRCVLIALLHRLALNGDDVEACLQQGAASIFATGSEDVREPDWQRGDLKVWCGERRLVVRERHKQGHASRTRRRLRRLGIRKGRKRDWWSSFEWDGADWVASDASSRHRLDALMTRYPSLAKLAHRAMKSGRWR